MNPLESRDRTAPPGFATRRVAAVAAVLALLAASGARADDAIYVDRSSPATSDIGPGTPDSPYSTITAAVRDHHGPGVTIVVRPGVYREFIEIQDSGAPGSPFVLRGDGPGVVLDGADDFSSPALWRAASGDVWVARSVDWAPKQVFADGARLQASTAPPFTLPAGCFRYVPRIGLFVNAGAGGPAAHGVLVGHRAHGFDLDGHSDVRIEGFTVLRSEDRGIRLPASSDRDTVVSCVVAYSASYGIFVTGCAGVRIASNLVANNLNHGIGFVYGVTESSVEDNDSFGNWFPAWRQANGIYVRGSGRNQFMRNRLHDNQDSGLDVGGGSNDNRCVENLSWRNGDHGFDNTHSTGNRHIGDVAWGNQMDGFSFEGNSTGCSVFDCIATENGLTTREYDLWVDLPSWGGFQSDYNLFWNSTTRTPIAIGSNRFTSVAAFAAWGSTDAHTLQADPRFTNPASGCFELLADSPAIDSGDSQVPDWPATDAAQRPRIDDPGASNQGIGPVAYVDRGALERDPAGRPALATSLTADPSRGAPPLAVVADASASSPTGSRIVSYRFDFGDGTRAGPQLDPRANHVYDRRAVWTVGVTVTDAWGNQGRAETQVDMIYLGAPKGGGRFDAGPATGTPGSGSNESAAPAAPRSGAGANAVEPDPAFAGAPGRGPIAVRLAPNPMRTEGWLSFTTSRAGPVRVTLFDLGGRRVRYLLDEPEVSAGPHEIRIDRAGAGAGGMQSGVYFYRIETAEAAVTGRVVLTP